MKKFRILILFILSAFFFSCSSMPDREMKVTTTSDTAAIRYETANSELASGNYELALMHFSQAYNLAFSVDNADLLCRIALSGISYKIITGTLNATDKKSESFISSLSIEEILDDAKYFAQKTSRIPTLSAICSIYEVEILLARGEKTYSAYETKLKSVEKDLKKEPYYLAHLYRILGDVYISSKNYNSAVESYKKAAEIHTKNHYLFEIGTDWYGVARSYSLSGNKQLALSSMENALKFDRDAENSSAIAFDYFATAKILVKGVCNVEEKKRAKEYARWASSIFKSNGMKNQSEICERFIKEIK